MKKLFYIMILTLFASTAFATAIPGWPTFYDSFEDGAVPDRDLDTLLDDTTGGPFDTPEGDGAEYDDQTHYVRDVTEDGITPRYGDQYLHIKATWGAPEDTSSAHTGDKGFGRIGFKRGWITFHGDELTSGDVGLDIDNGTEYWIGWSQYIPADEKEQHADFIAETGAFQIQSERGLASISYWGMDNGVYRVVRYYGTGSFKPITLANWIDLKGTWVDFVVQYTAYTSDTAGARLRYYVNGVLKTGAWDNLQNARNSTLRPYLVWQNYNWWSWGDWDADVDCSTTQTGGYYNYCGCSNAVDDGSTTPECAGDWTAWTRNYILDEMRINEYDGTPAQGAHYCAVAPPIWAETPSISHPSEAETNLGTTFNASFTDFSPHRLDPQGCFPAYKMEVEVDIDGHNWTDHLDFDSGEVDSSNTISITGLAADTTYQMRVRHSSYNTPRTTQYWGEWSTVIDFSTDLPPDPEPSLSLGGLEVGGNTAVATDGNTDLAIP